MKHKRKFQGSPAQKHTSYTPRWFPVMRFGAGCIAALFFFNGVALSVGPVPGILDVLLALGTLALWFSPWFWFPQGWLWWPLYLASAVISFGQTRTTVAVWLAQMSPSAMPFVTWPASLQYLTLCATLFTLLGVWQTVALGMARVTGFRGRRRR